MGLLADEQFWRDVNGRLVGLLGPQMQGLNQFAGLLSGTVEPKDFLGMRAQQLDQQFSPANGLLGLTVFHGSPAKFSAFDMGKVGTGEGTQVSGHGAYFSVDPSEAAAYGPNIYKTQAPENVLDIHAPLSEQPEAVKTALGSGAKLGGDAYGELAQKLGSQAAASAYLRSRGVAGLKYGVPTKGYVLFNPALE